MTSCILFLATFVLCTAPVSAADLTPPQQRDVLAEAQQSYDRGIALLRGNPSEARAAFQSAAQKFRLVADSGVANGCLLYNLANSQLQSGDIGQAILNYRRAQRLIPGDPRLQSNLDFARTQCRTPVAASGQRALTSALLQWHDHTPTRTRFTIFIVAWVVFWCAMFLRMLRPNGAWTLIAAVTAVLWLAMGLSVASDLTGIGRHSTGVILADNVTVRKGNGTGFEPQIAQTLAPGVEFDLLEQRGDWLNIQLSNGSSGWIESAQAELVR